MQNRPSAVVLLAEDNPAEQNLARRAFHEARVDCDLRIVSDGEEALQYLERRGPYADPALSPRPSLLLLDLNMPRLDGRQVLQRLKQHPELRALPVVVLTTSSAEQDVSNSYQLGCNLFVQKPFLLQEFIAALEALRDYWIYMVKLPSVKLNR
jgi:CheY-like chemotaxis protein